MYTDYERDPEYASRWHYTHDANWFDNSNGIEPNAGKYITTPINPFTKVGKYEITLQKRDNPKNDERFDNYRLWSRILDKLVVYVHRKPAALQRLTVTNNGNGTFTVRAFDAGSYDLDHSLTRSDKGIVDREWRWKESSESIWHTGQMNKADCRPDKAYITQLRVQDVEGVWSEYNTIELDANSPPAALFLIDKNPMYVSESLKLKDLSFPRSFSTLNRWHWVIKKFNDDGTLPDENIQNGQYGASNSGTGSLAGYDTNVKTNYADTGMGKYRIYLRVRDSNGLWSDGGTDGTFNLNNFYYQDIAVQESFKLTNFRVVKIRDFHLEPYYNASGKYPDRPFHVNSMAIDPSNFQVGGISIVPGFSGLTKGYRFEFEIDSVNFNEANDTIVITPTFYTYTSGVPGIRGPQADLYWEDCNKSILKAGEGGHSRWATIALDKGNRTITGANSATWRSEYFIPATSWLVPTGTSEDNAKAARLNSDIIVNFTIRGYKNGAMKYDYNLQQWPIERATKKHPYEIGDVIRYDHAKNNLDDSSIIINRP